MTVRRLVPLLAAAIALAACGGGARQASVPGAPPPEVPRDAVPERLLGLRSERESVRKQFAEAADRAYVTSLRMWSLREGDRLRATVEVARFAPDAASDDRTFQRTMIAQLGSSVPRVRRIGARDVYVTPGNSQTLYLWFARQHFVLVAVSVDYPRPRALVRAAIREVTP